MRLFADEVVSAAPLVLVKDRLSSAMQQAATSSHPNPTLQTQTLGSSTLYSVLDRNDDSMNADMGEDDQCEDDAAADGPLGIFLT